MKRIIASAAVAMFFLATVMSGSAGAHTFVANTSLSIHKAPTTATAPGANVNIFGKLQSPRRSCRVDKVVKLFKVLEGPDKLLAKDRTDNEGTYGFVRQPSKDMKVYTKFFGSLKTSYGHSHKCLASQSSKLFIDVKG
jgi:hypothetical protein